MFDVRAVWLAVAVTLAALRAFASDEPPPPPPWPVPPNPIVCLSKTPQPPVIDGTIDFETEWKDATVLSAFYQKDLDGLAPPESQGRFLIKVDDQHLYAAARTPIYPPGKQLRAFEKQHDNLDGVVQGDYAALELLPIRGKDPRQVSSTGSFSLLWNVLGTLCDLHPNGHPGQLVPEWHSGAVLENSVTAEHWDTELRLPLAGLLHLTMEKVLRLPPQAGDRWSLGMARLFGKGGSNLFTTWDNHPLIVQEPHMDAQVQAWAHKPEILFGEGCVAVQLHSLGDLTGGRIETDITFYNPDTVAHPVTVALHIQDSQGAKLWADTAAVTVEPGARASCPPLKARVDYEPRGSALFIRIVQDGQRALYATPALALLKFDEETRRQFLRSLEMLRQP